MNSEGATVAPVAEKTAAGKDVSPKGSNPGKKNHGKVPKRIHKAEREKMKREHLNELFLALANALDVSEPNNGKASVLGEATRFLKDLVTQIEHLKKENAALLSESQYVYMEKKELQDENSALENQIGKLKNKVNEQVAELKLDLNVAPPESQHQDLSQFTNSCLQLPTLEPTFQQAQVVNPMYVFPFCSDLQVYPEAGATLLASKPMAVVSKPHARYPTPSDNWPSELLDKQSGLGKELQQSRSHTGGCAGRRSQ